MKISLHTLSAKYMAMLKCTNAKPEAQDFLNFCTGNISEEYCNEVQIHTVNQSKTSKWFEARYARITASKIYEASKCKTPEGSLLECLLGATKIVQNNAMSRGLKLESDVLQIVESSHNLKIRNVGIYINKNYPIFGASPDGVTTDLCIEIKCPTKIKTISNYISANNEIKQKYFAQIQMQMFLSGRDKGLLYYINIIIIIIKDGNTILLY